MARLVKVASILFTQQQNWASHGENPEVLKLLEGELDSLKGLGLDLVVTCESIESLCQNMDEAESVADPGPVIRIYQEFARSENCTLAGSVKLREGQKIYNSIVYIGPEGSVLGAYHKTFLTYRELDMGMSPGDGARVVETPAGRLGGVVCFDLNFEELCDQYVPLKPDIITFPSMYHGGFMQSVWAYRCRSYFVSSLAFQGGGVLDPLGQTLVTTDCYNTTAITTINLDRALVHLDRNRQHFLEIQRKYLGKINLSIPPNIGPAIITSLTDEITAMDVVNEFNLTLLDDYLATSKRDNDDAR